MRFHTFFDENTAKKRFFTEGSYFFPKNENHHLYKKNGGS